MGKFIVLEGCDATGKSSIIERLKQDLNPNQTLFIKDPGFTEIGGKIREILLDINNENLSPVSELMLYLASRAQLVHEVIEPNILLGKTIISDRFTLSTLVYQHSVSRYGNLHEIVNFGLNNIQPDLNILLDVEPEIIMQRLSKRQLDRIESKGVNFYKEVRKRYIDYAKVIPNVKIVNAEKDIDEVYSNVYGMIISCILSE
jgi:dTMP kinase